MPLSGASRVPPIFYFPSMDVTEAPLFPKENAEIRQYYIFQKFSFEDSLWRNVGAIFRLFRNGALAATSVPVVPSFRVLTKVQHLLLTSVYLPEYFRNGDDQGMLFLSFRYSLSLPFHLVVFDLVLILYCLMFDVAGFRRSRCLSLLRIRSIKSSMVMPRAPMTCVSSSTNDAMRFF